MIEKSFLALLWSSFKKTYGPILTGLSLFLAIIFWKFPSNEKIGLDIILPISIFLLMLLITLADTAYLSFKMDKRIVPRVILGREFSSKILLLLEPSKFFSHDTLVSFYYNEGFEQLIGIGRVLNVQEDKNIQVILTHPLPGHESTLRKLSQSESTILRKIIVKPSIPMSIAEYLTLGGE